MNKGILYGVGAYVLWGIFPIYFKLVKVVPAPQILGHRVVWSFLLLAVIVFSRKEWPELLKSIRQPKTAAIYLTTAIILSINWLIYIWAVNAGMIVETSLGYFINPLINILLGVIFLRERLRLFQWAPIAVASLGVGYMTVGYGQLPWVALVLAITFGVYGLIKKVAPLSSLHGLTLETTMLALPAALYLGLMEVQGSGWIGRSTLPFVGLLMISGATTSIPLLMFGAAVRRISLSLVGLLQYIAPTIQFLIGVWVYNEPFDQVRMVGFGLIWLALILLWTEGIIERRKFGPRPQPVNA